MPTQTMPALRTAAANAARSRKRQERLAAELRKAGWVVTRPAAGDEPVTLPEVHQDADTRAVYVRLDGRMGFPIGEVREVAPGVHLDYDTDGKLVGVEIL